MDGPEVAPCTRLEVSPQPDANMYYVHGGVSGDTVLNQLDRSSLPQAGSLAKIQPTRILFAIGVVCFTAALGTGLGAGVAVRYFSSSSSSAKPTKTATITIMQTRNASDITACSTTLESYAPTQTPLPTRICPAANGSTYIATKTDADNPVSSFHPYQQIQNSSFSFEVLCNTNFIDDFQGGGPIRDIQIIDNVSTLTDCLTECAMYNFRTPEEYFPTWACTGVSWGEQLPPEKFTAPSCWLKANVSLASPNGTDLYGGFDGGVLLNI